MQVYDLSQKTNKKNRGRFFFITFLAKCSAGRSSLQKRQRGDFLSTRNSPCTPFPKARVNGWLFWERVWGHCKRPAACVQKGPAGHSRLKKKNKIQEVECSDEIGQKGGDPLGISHTYALSEAEVIIVYDLGLQVLLDELKLRVTFTVRRHEAPDVHHLLARRRGQFGDGDDLFDVMHVPLWKHSQRSRQDPARQLKGHGRLLPHLPVFNTGFSLHFPLFFFPGFQLTQLLLRSHGRTAHSGSSFCSASP